MRVIEFIHNLSPEKFAFYAELSKIETPVRYCHDYRILWTESGTIDDYTMNCIRDELELLYIPAWAIAVLDNDELHFLLINYTTIVHEQVVHVLGQQDNA